MKQPTPSPDWPESWCISYNYDLLELFGGQAHHRGYAYAYAARRQHTQHRAD